MDKLDYLRIIIAVVFLFIVFLKYKNNNLNIIYFYCLSLFFPLHITILNRQILTLSTLIVLFAFFYEITFLSNKIILKIKYKIWLKFFIFFCIFSLFSLNNDLLFKSFRWLLYYISSIFIFLIIINKISKFSELEKILNYLFIGFSINILVSILILLGFNIESVSQFFGPNDIIAFVESGLIRPAGLLKDYEIFAEIAVVLAFMSIFLYFFTRKFKYVLYFIVFLSGALITLTRSFLIMLIIGIILHLFIPFTSSGKKIKIIITLFCFFLILYLGLYHFTPSLINNFVDRINEISILLNYDVSTEELINRQQVHEPFQFLLIGNGTRFEKIQFHSLYLTLNYQIGTLGLISFLIFISLIFFNAFKTILTTYNNKQKLTISYLALVFILILINEYKIEFVRYSFSTEFTWLMLGLLYKVANDPFVFDNELKL